MVEAARKVLRLTTDAFDEEIRGLIDACKLEMRLAGVKNILDDDPLVRRAILAYVKAHFGYSDDNRLPLRHYNTLVSILRLDGGYRV